MAALLRDTNHQSTETRPNLPHKIDDRETWPTKRLNPDDTPQKSGQWLEHVVNIVGSNQQKWADATVHMGPDGVSDSTWWNPCMFCSVTHWARTQWKTIQQQTNQRRVARCRPPVDKLVIVGLLTAVRAYLPELQSLSFWVQLSQRPWASTCRHCWHFKVTN